MPLIALALRAGQWRTLSQFRAMLQDNLGKAFYELGHRNSDKEEGCKLLEDAVTAYRSALEVRTKADLPQDWASTQSNLAKALRTLGKLLEGEEGLKHQLKAVEFAP